MSILESAAIEPASHPAATAPSALARVLVIDDEEIVCNTLGALLKAEGFDAITTRSGREGVELLRSRQMDVVISDLVMPGMDGIQTIAALKEVDPAVAVIILTGHVTVDSTIAALRQGACDFLQKPTAMAQLRPALMRAREKRRGELTRVEAHSRAVIETAREAIVLFDREGVVRDFNPSAEQIFGLSREQAVGRNLADFAIPPRRVDVFRGHLERAYREGRDPLHGCVEVYALRQNGEEFPMEISTAAIETPQGRLLSTFGYDIPARKQAESALEERTVYLNALFEISPLGIVVLNIEGCIQMSNSAFEMLFGYSRQEIMGANLDDFLVPKELAAEAKTLTNWCLGGAGAYATSRRRRKDGSHVDVDIFGVPLVIEGKRHDLLHSFAC